jgi:GTPase
VTVADSIDRPLTQEESLLWSPGRRRTHVLAQHPPVSSVAHHEHAIAVPRLVRLGITLERTDDLRLAVLRRTTDTRPVLLLSARETPKDDVHSVSNKKPWHVTSSVDILAYIPYNHIIITLATMEDLTQTTYPTIALVGRVNVGKSTLFNRVIEEKKAIVSTQPGTTRTNNEGDILWRGQYIHVIDTGGLTFEDDVVFEKDILKQSERAMKSADLIVLVTDAKDGILPQEKKLATRLRRISQKPVLLVANKTDNEKIKQTLTDPTWYKLGLGEPFPVSAASGRHVGDFLDRIYTMLDMDASAQQEDVEQSQPTDSIRISLIGKPNVGKSSLFNKLIGQDRVIVSDIAHTTREPYDTAVMFQETRMTFVDTAGIRRKAKVKGKLEQEGIGKSIQAVDHSDIVLFVLDGSETISSQDRQLGGLLEKHSKSVIILINKWDLADDTSDIYRKEVARMIHMHFPHLSFAHVMFVSGKTGYGVHKIFNTILQVWTARHTNIAERRLEKFLERATTQHRPARGKGTRHPKLLGMRQVNTAPPIFELFVKYRTSLHRSYVHYLENRLREQFDFTGTPIVIKLRKTKK